MAKDLKEALVNIEAKLGGEEKPHMDLGGHLDYIESLLEQGAGGAGGELYLDVSPYITYTSETGGTITQEGFDLIQTKLNSGEIMGVDIGGTFFNYAYSNAYSVDPNEPLKTKLIFLLNAENEIYLKLTIDETLTWSVESEPISSGGGSGFNIFDNAFSIGVAENINEETLTLTEVGLNKINSMFTNGKLLGLCFEDPANITTDFTFIPFVSLTDGNYWFTGTTYITGTNLQFTQIKINKTTGAIEMVQKLIAATDVE